MVVISSKLRIFKLREVNVGKRGNVLPIVCSWENWESLFLIS